MGKSGNQQLNEWPFDRIIKILTYKARLKGIRVVKKEENYTSQTRCS
jgi:putative transposase